MLVEHGVLPGGEPLVGPVEHHPPNGRRAAALHGQGALVQVGPVPHLRHLHCSGSAGSGRRALIQLKAVHEKAPRRAAAAPSKRQRSMRQLAHGASKRTD